MPCNDITEVLAIRLDSDERLVDYSLHKISCGEAVAGRGLIRKWAKGKTIAEIMALKPEMVLADEEIDSAVGEYLRLKHLFAIQSALAGFTGDVTTVPGSFCSMESIDYTSDGVSIQASINLDILTDKIKACGLCGDACKPER